MQISKTDQKIQYFLKKVSQLEFKVWMVTLKTILLPITTIFRRIDRHITWKLWDVFYGSKRIGVYPEVSLSVLINQPTSVKLIEIPDLYYNVSPLELLAISGITSQIQPKKVFEFGTADGRTTRNIAANIETYNDETQVYTINLPLEDDKGHSQSVPVGYRFRNTPEEEIITQFFGDTKTFDFSPYFHQCQLIFIDADHSEKGVIIDSGIALNLIDTQLGMIIWHDALSFGVQVALPRLISEKNLPIHLITDTSMAILCFLDGKSVTPNEWCKALSLGSPAVVGH